MRNRVHRAPEAPTLLQQLPPSILQIIALNLAPVLLKHTFRTPSYYISQRALLAASLTCKALRSVCFPLAIEVLRSPALRPANEADLSQSLKDLERRLDAILETKRVWPHIRKLDIEIYTKAPLKLVSKLITLVESLPHLTFLALKLPAYRIFRDAFIEHLKNVLDERPGIEFKRISVLCIDAKLSFVLPYMPGVRELVVWSWPSDVDREGGLDRGDTVDAWRTLLARLHTQAPGMEEVEVGGLSIYDLNELFPSVSNYISDITMLRILHRKEEHGALPLLLPPSVLPSRSPSPSSNIPQYHVPIPYHHASVPFDTIPPDILESTSILWEDTVEDDPPIIGRPGSVKRIVYFDLQEECGSVYVPGTSRTRSGSEKPLNGEKEEKDRDGKEEAGEENGSRNQSKKLKDKNVAEKWVDFCPALVLSAKSMKRTS